jgi:WD40 repeat protein
MRTALLLAVVSLGTSGCGIVGPSLAWPTAAPAPGLVRVLTGHTLWVSSVAWSPDGKLIASGSGDRTLRVWEVATGKTVTNQKLERGGVERVAWSPDGKYLATGHNEPSDQVRIWDTASWKPIHKKNVKGMVHALEWSPNGKMVAAGLGFIDPDPSSKDIVSGVTVYDSATGRTLATLTIPDDVHSLAWSPDSKQLAFRALVTDPASSRSGYVSVWAPSSEQGWDNANSDSLVRIDQPEGTSDVSWSPDGKYLVASAGDDLKLIDTATWQSSLTLMSYPNSVGHVRWSPDGKRIALGSSPTVEVWDVQQRKQVKSFPLFDAVNDIAWSPDSKLLATASEDHYVRIWEVK